MAVTDTANIANVSWKEIFTDPKLQALIEEGLENNVNMQAAVLRVEEAKVCLHLPALLIFHPSTSLLKGPLLLLAVGIMSRLILHRQWQLGKWTCLANC